MKLNILLLYSYALLLLNIYSKVVKTVHTSKNSTLTKYFILPNTLVTLFVISKNYLPIAKNINGSMMLIHAVLHFYFAFTFSWIIGYNHWMHLKSHRRWFYFAGILIRNIIRKSVLKPLTKNEGRKTLKLRY